jgi:hypothetical protein
MDRFVRKENIRHFRDLLRDAKSDAERHRIHILLGEELAKQKAAGDEFHVDAPQSGSTEAPKTS